MSGGRAGHAARRLALAALAGGGAACAGGAHSAPDASPAGGEEPEYALRDTTAYESTVYGSLLALLYRNGRFVDSVDANFGVPRVPGGVLLLPVRSEEREGLGTVTSFTRHVLYDGTTRRELRDLVPAFDDHFSSPAVIDGKLWYWGFREDARGTLEVHAMRHDFGTSTTDGVFLYRDPVATDNPFHFRPPAPEDGRVRFESGDRAFRVDGEMEVVGEERDAGTGSR